MGAKFPEWGNAPRSRKKLAALSDKTNSLRSASMSSSSLSPADSQMARDTTQTENTPNKENVSNLVVSADVFFGKKKNLRLPGAGMVDKLLETRADLHSEEKRVTRRATAKSQVSNSINEKCSHVLKVKKVSNQENVSKLQGSEFGKKSNETLTVVNESCISKGHSSPEKRKVTRGLKHKLNLCAVEYGGNVSERTNRLATRSSSKTPYHDENEKAQCLSSVSSSLDKKTDLTKEVGQQRKKMLERGAALNVQEIRNILSDNLMLQEQPSNEAAPSEQKRSTRRNKPICEADGSIVENDNMAAAVKESSLKLNKVREAVPPIVFFGRKKRIRAASGSSLSVSTKKPETVGQQCSKEVVGKKRKSNDTPLPVYKNCQFSDEKQGSSIYNFDETLSDEENGCALAKKRKIGKKRNVVKRANRAKTAKKVPIWMWAAPKTKPVASCNKKTTTNPSNPDQSGLTPKTATNAKVSSKQGNYAKTDTSALKANSASQPLEACDVLTRSPLILQSPSELKMHPNAVSTPVHSSHATKFRKHNLSGIPAPVGTSPNLPDDSPLVCETANVQKKLAGSCNLGVSVSVHEKSVECSMGTAVPLEVERSPLISTPVRPVRSLVQSAVPHPNSPHLTAQVETKGAGVINPVFSNERQARVTHISPQHGRGSHSAAHVESNGASTSTPVSSKEFPAKTSCTQSSARSTISHSLQDCSSANGSGGDDESEMSDLFSEIPRDLKVCVPTRKFTTRGGSYVTPSGKTVMRHERPVRSIIPLDARLPASESRMNSSTNVDTNENLNYSVDNAFGFDDEGCHEEAISSLPMRAGIKIPVHHIKCKPLVSKPPIKEVIALLKGQKIIVPDTESSEMKSPCSQNQTVQTKLTDFVSRSSPSTTPSTSSAQTPYPVTPSPVPLFGEESLDKELPSPFLQPKRRSYDRMQSRRKVACGDEVVSDDEIGEFSEATTLKESNATKKKTKVTYRKGRKKMMERDAQIDEWATEIASHFNDVEDIQLEVE